PARLAGLPLALPGSRGAGDDGPGVTHGLARRSREAGDVGEHRLLPVLADECGSFLLFVAADLADHDDQLCLRIVLELCEHVDERGANNRIAADADDRRVP